jgi:hypothetical protein
MIVAIGGMRANSGAWGLLNRQQQKFSPYNLDSYARGDLELSIMPRQLLSPTKLEIAQEKQAMWQGVGAAVTAGVPLPMALEDEGWDDERLEELQTIQAEKEAQRNQALAQAKVNVPDQVAPQENMMGSQSKTGAMSG